MPSSNNAPSVSQSQRFNTMNGTNSGGNGVFANSNDNFRVCVRVRPPLPKEQIPGLSFSPIVNVSKDNRSVSIMEYLGAEINEAER